MRPVAQQELSARGGLIAELLAVLGFEEGSVTARTAAGGSDVRGTLVVGEVRKRNEKSQRGFAHVRLRPDAERPPDVP